MFKVGDIIKINGKEFTISKINEEGTEFETLNGSLQGDPKFLAGKRTVVTKDLKGKGKSFKYVW